MQKFPNKLGGEQVLTQPLSQRKGTGRTNLVSDAVWLNKNCLIVEDVTDRLSRNVGTELHSTLRDMPKERRSHLHRRGGLKSRRPVFLLHTFLIASGVDPVSTQR